MLLETDNRRPKNSCGLGLQVSLDVNKFPTTLQLQDCQMVRVHDVIHGVLFPRRCYFSTCVGSFLIATFRLLALRARWRFFRRISAPSRAISAKTLPSL